MALQFIFGGSGSGKTWYLYHKVIEEAGKNPALNYIVLVPEQFTMQTQKDLVMLEDVKGIMNIDVLSFVRLAYRIFEETGQGNTPVLDDEGKSLILRRIAGRLAPDLAVLRGNLKRPGYISEVKSILSEFDQYDVSSEALAQVMDAVGEDSHLYYKLKDLKLVYEQFYAFLKDRYVTKEELLDLLIRAVPDSEILKNSVIVLDGFTGFTPVQNRLLEKLMIHARDILVTVTIDPACDPYIYHGNLELFGLSRHTASTLTKIARQAGVEQKEPVWLNDRPYPRFAQSQELAFLEQNIFRYGEKRFNGNADAIQILVAANPRKEAEVCAAKVRELVRKEGLRYREIGVILTDPDLYGDYLARAFARYEIPVFMDMKRNILLNSFVEYVRSILGMEDEGFSYDSVFRFLRAGYGPFGNEDIDALDNYCLAFGIRGYKQWQQPWTRRTRDMTPEDLDLLNHLRSVLVEENDELVFVLRQRRKTVRDITEALYRFLEMRHLQEKVKKQEDAFAGKGEFALAKEYAQVYPAVIGLFDKFVELLGDEPVSLSDYRELLDAGLNEARIGVIPPGLDQVITGDIRRTRLKDIKALLVLGLNDTLLPGNLTKASLLGERDRECFAAQEIPLTPGAKEQAYIQKFYLYMGLTKPSEYLILLYSKSSGDGKAIRPAYLIGDICGLYPGLKIVDTGKTRLAERELTPKTAIPELLDGFAMDKDGAGSAWMELYNWYKTHPKWAEKMEELQEAACFTYRPAKLSEESARRLYGEHFKNSISRMEQFGACAYAHFLRYGLRLSERQEFEFSALDLGNVFHSAIERYARYADKVGGWTKISPPRQKELIEKSIREAMADYGSTVINSSSRDQYMISRLNRLMGRTVWALTDQLNKGDFVPKAYELNFGTGKIDRMDVCYDREAIYVKIMDYKTGSASFDVGAFYHGRQLQLMVYMNAAVDYVGKKNPKREVIPAGVFYYCMQDPLVNKKDAADAEEKILRKLRMEGIVNLDRESLHHLDHSGLTDSTVIPVKFNKDGSLSKYSSVASKEDFDTMLKYADFKSRQFNAQIRSGDVAVNPVKDKNSTACDYCSFRHVCGFDERLSGYRGRVLEDLDREKALAKMRYDMAEAGRKGGDS